MMMAMATMRRSMQQKRSLHQLHPTRFRCNQCLLSSFPLSANSDSNDGNTRSGRNCTARRRFNTTFHALPLLFQNNFSSFQQQERRWFGNTALVSSPSHPSSQSTHKSLPLPTVVYSDNHLLAVNKPAGWHSVPNIPKKRGLRHKQESHPRDGGGNSDRDSDSDREIPPDARPAAENRIHRKCLLTHLQSRGLGGGSQRDFLLPLHRIDQPCTGILLFGKTSKAASRITAVWKGKKPKRNKKQKGTAKANTNTNANANANANGSVVVPRGVTKEYLCVVPTSRLAAMEETSVPVPTESKSNVDGTNEDATKTQSSSPAADGALRPAWNRLDGLMLRQSASSSPSELYGRNNHHRWQQQKYYKDRRNKGKSVRIVRRGRKTSGGDTRLAEPRHGGGDNDGDGDGASSDSFYEYDHEADNAMMRPVSVDWKTVDVPAIDPACTLLLVRTSEGARHMVRALLAQVGDCPIVGDLRYWTTPKRTTGRGRGHSRPGDRAGIHDGESEDARDRDGDRNRDSDSDSGPVYHDKGPLPDRSVALHAYGVVFDRGQLRLGSLETFEFRAPVPTTWKTFFGIENRQVKNAMRCDTNDLGFGERL